MTNENEKDDWVDEPAEPSVKPKAEPRPEAKPEKKAERKEAVPKKKPAKKTKAAKVAPKAKSHPILKGRVKKAKGKRAAKKAEPRSKITLNFKVVPAEAEAIRKLADDKFKGNVTQMIRAKLLGLSVSKEALASIRKTTRT